VEATATFETQTKVALVRIGTRGRLVFFGLVLTFLAGFRCIPGFRMTALGEMGVNFDALRRRVCES